MILREIFFDIGVGGGIYKLTLPTGLEGLCMLKMTPEMNSAPLKTSLYDDFTQNRDMLLDFEAVRGGQIKIHAPYKLQGLLNAHNDI